MLPALILEPISLRGHWRRLHRGTCSQVWSLYQRSAPDSRLAERTSRRNGGDGINSSLLDTGVPDSGAERLRGKISQCCVLRSFLRLRDTLVKDCSSQVLRMQKALTEMNVQVHRVLSDITGESGMAIIRAILAGERDPLKLAQMKHPRVKASTEQIVKALEGDYRAEHLFGLQTAVELYDAYQLKILQCEAKVEEHLQQLETQLDFAEVLAQNQESRGGGVPAGSSRSDAKQDCHRRLYPPHQRPPGRTHRH